MAVPAHSRSYSLYVDAPSPDDYSKTVRLGVRQETFQRINQFGLKTSIAQFYDIVQNGLILAVHSFRGLNRPMMREGDTEADRSFIIYSWKPVYDSEWIGDQFSGMIERLNPPSDRVYVVIAREIPPGESEVVAEIERWNWVREDLELPLAPIDYKERYGKKLWSRNI